MKVQNDADTDQIATYSGVFDGKPVLFVAVESDDSYGPKTMELLENHVELIGRYEQMMGTVFVLFYFRKEVDWYRMSIRQLKLCWRTWAKGKFDENCFQIKNLKRIRNTAFGPDFLEKINSPFAVVKKETDDPLAVFE